MGTYPNSNAKCRSSVDPRQFEILTMQPVPAFQAPIVGNVSDGDTDPTTLIMRNRSFGLIHVTPKTRAGLLPSVNPAKIDFPRIRGVIRPSWLIRCSCIRGLTSSSCNATKVVY